MQSFVNDTKTGQIFLSNKMSIFHWEFLTSENTKKEKKRIRASLNKEVIGN